MRLDHPRKYVSSRSWFPDTFWRQINALLEAAKVATECNMTQHAFKMSNDKSPSLVHMSSSSKRLVCLGTEENLPMGTGTALSPSFEKKIPRAKKIINV